jgi:hypothetical protein
MPCKLSAKKPGTAAAEFEIAYRQFDSARLMHKKACNGFPMQAFDSDVAQGSGRNGGF